MKIDSSRIVRRPHLAFDTPIGTKVSLKTPAQEKLLWTVFLGMEKNRFILLRLPRELNDGPVAGNRLAIKYVKENLIFGFSASVLYTVRSPFPLLFLDYPKSVENLDLRRDRRAICFLPVTLYWDDARFPGHIIDLSRGGCRIAVDLTVAPPLAALEKNLAFFSQFNLQDHGDIYAQCVVKNLIEDRQKFFLGVKFRDLTREIEQQIGSYVRTINECRGCFNPPGRDDDG